MKTQDMNETASIASPAERLRRQLDEHIHEAMVLLEDARTTLDGDHDPYSEPVVGFAYRIGRTRSCVKGIARHLSQIKRLCEEVTR